MNIRKNTTMIFNNNKKQAGDKKPDMIGECNIECPMCHKEFDVKLALWAQVASNNNKYLKGMFTFPDPTSPEYQKKKLEDQKSLEAYQKIKGGDVKNEDLPF